MAQQKSKPTDDWVDISADDDWKDISTDDWQDVEEDSPFPVKKKEPSALNKFVDWASAPLTTAPSQFAREKAESFYGDTALSKYPRLMGFFKGADEAAGDVISGLTSPANLAMTLLGAGEFAAGGRGIANLLRTGTRVASAIPAYHGTKTALDTEKSAGERLFGVAEAAGGLAGTRVLPEVNLGIKPTPGKSSRFAKGEVVNVAGKDQVVTGFDSKGKPILKIADQLTKEPAANVDPNFRGGEGDPELAGSVPYKQTEKPLLRSKDYKPSPKTEEAVDKLFPGMKKTGQGAKFNLEPIQRLMRDEEGSFDIDAIRNLFAKEETPEGGLPQTEDPYAGPSGTSFYKPEIAKELGRLQVELMDEGPIKNAFSAAQQKYPRLMGHVGEIDLAAPENASFMDRFFDAGGSRAIESDSPLSRVRINPDSPYHMTDAGIANTVGHELTHAAQRLRRGEPRFNREYNEGGAPILGSKELGYMANPMERSARAAGSKFSEPFRNAFQRFMADESGEFNPDALRRYPADEPIDLGEMPEQPIDLNDAPLEPNLGPEFGEDLTGYDMGQVRIPPQMGPRIPHEFQPDMPMRAAESGPDVMSQSNPEMQLEYAFDWPDFHEGGGSERMFNVVGEHPESGSTLSETTLRERGIKIPEPPQPSFFDRLQETLMDESGSIPRKPKSENVWANLDDRVKKVFTDNEIGPADLEGMTLKDVNDTYDAVVRQMSGLEPEAVPTKPSAQEPTAKLVKKTGERKPLLTEDEQIERLTNEAMAAVERERAAMLKFGEPEMSPEELQGIRDRMQSGERFDIPKQEAPSTGRENIPLLRAKDYFKNFMKNEKGELDLGALFQEQPEGAESMPPPGTTLPTEDLLQPNIPVQERSFQAPEERSMFGKVLDFPKGAMSVDLPFMTSAAFRQASPLAWTPEWFNAWGKAAKAYGSEAATRQMENEIFQSKYFKPRYKPRYDAEGNLKGYKEIGSIAEEMGVKGVDRDTTLTRGEEINRSQLAEKLPGIWGDAIKRSNRAYSMFLKHMRQTKFEQLMEQTHWSGGANDVTVAKALAEFVNDATGRGSLKWEGPGGRKANLERIAPYLQNALWSPRLLAAKTKFLNPFTYTNLPAPVRQQYINGTLRMAATWMSFAGLAKMAGAQVNLDPTNSDFGKIRIGDMRIDPAGGLQQLLVFTARELPQAVGAMGGFKTGRFTSSTTNKTKEFGKGAFPVDRGTIAEDFITSKLNPEFKLAYDLMRASDKRPVHLGDRAIQMALPIMAQDLMDVMKKDPDLAKMLGMSLSSSVGMGTGFYGKGEKIGDPVFTDSIENQLGLQKRSLSGTIGKF